MTIVGFLTEQYKRIEKRERGRYTVNYPLKAPCPVCSDRPDGFESGRVGADEIRLEPCGHAIPNDEFVKLYAESRPDPFVLADIASKRAILAEHQPEGEHLPYEDGTPACGRCGDYGMVEWPCVTVRLLAAPFSAEPGYDERWAV